MENSSKLERFDNTLSELEEELGKLKGTAVAFKSLKELVSTYGDIGKHQEKIDGVIAEIKETNIENYKLLRQENKDAYFDFEKTLKIKLEENKSEIKRLIEDERLKVKEIITAELDKRTEILLKNQGGIKSAVLILGIIILLISIASVVIQVVK